MIFKVKPSDWYNYIQVKQSQLKIGINSKCSFGDDFHENKTCNEVDPTGACIAFAGGCSNNIRKSDCDNGNGKHNADKDCDTVYPNLKILFFYLSPSLAPKVPFEPPMWQKI